MVAHIHAQKEIVREKEIMLITVNKICVRHTDIVQPKSAGWAQLHGFACLSFILNPLPSLCDRFTSSAELQSQLPSVALLSLCVLQKKED